MKKISVSINSQDHDVFENSTLEDLIANKKISPSEVTTAVNNTFVPKTDRKKYILKNADSVIVFSAITGG